MGNEADRWSVRRAGRSASDLGGATGPDLNHDPITRWLAAIAVVLLTFILTWALIASARGPSVADQLDRIERQFAYTACLVLIPDEERVSRGLLECQPVDNPLGG